MKSGRGLDTIVATGQKDPIDKPISLTTVSGEVTLTGDVIEIFPRLVGDLDRTIPTTRAKSPKFGRAKDSPKSEGIKISSGRTSRLSLDEKVSQNGLTKGSSPQHCKKPLRKSLPKLPSEKSTLANSTEVVISTQQLECDNSDQTEDPIIQDTEASIEEELQPESMLNALEISAE
ncbi:hypothetical protein GIB67_017819 [Kingdonia uniflora]|uniref:Uncharacterized protein n=1 Tax=Kingdonia uniflora TaxID=39325 RepID=A0A7J7MP66_9MAGN|nr:hypothetical protein GIB67_017819 [Kingdonia uniflora]